ncbi:MAG: cbb3-type cytochrome c oxidase N-terminal domain-containing protein [bacterium]
MSDQERDVVLDHEYDGIREFDNRLPNWWLWTLYGAIAFAVGYWMYYHTWSWGSLSHAKYGQEVAVAAQAQLARMANQSLSDESFQLMAAIPDNVQRGRAIFEQFCVTCHQADASGNIGPNLTDKYWIHGGKPMDILNTVTNGVPDKGMAAWGNQLGPTRVQDVVTYVVSIKGTNRPGKEPQGEPEGAEGESGAT